MASLSLSSRASSPQRHAALRPLRIVMYIIMLCAAFYFVYPLCWLIFASTKNNPDLISTSGFWFSSHFNFFANLQQLLTFDDGIFMQWMGNSFLYATGSSCVSTFIIALSGYALAKYSFPGKQVIFTVLLGTVLVPGTALMLPFYLLMSSLQLTNTYWSILLPTLFSAFGIWFACIYANASVPNELLDAARIDGAGELRIFLTIALPLMSPALATMFLFHFVGVWNGFFLPLLMLNNQHLYPVMVGLGVLSAGAGTGDNNTNLVIMGSLLSALPIVLSFTFLQRYWRQGLTFGSLIG